MSFIDTAQETEDLKWLFGNNRMKIVGSLAIAGSQILSL